MSGQQLIVSFQDATGWHTIAEYTSEGTAEQAGEWACVENRILSRLISDGLQIPLIDDPADMFITRVVVIRKSDGVKVCEWPVAELESGL